MLSTINKILYILDKNHGEYFQILKKNLSDLQPIAFLITMSLLISTFIGQNSVGQQYSVAASLTFFIVYLGLTAYNFCKKSVFLYWSSFIMLIGFYLLFLSYEGVLEKIFYNINGTMMSIIVIMLFSAVYAISLSLFINSNAQYKYYKFNKFLNLISLLIIMIFFIENLVDSDNLDYFAVYVAFICLGFSIFLSFFSNEKLLSIKRRI